MTSDVLLQPSGSLHRLSRSSHWQSSHLEMSVVRIRAVSCPEREMVGRAELGKKHRFGLGKPKGQETFSGCLWSWAISAALLALQESDVLSWSSVFGGRKHRHCESLPCPWQEAMSALSAWLLVLAPSYCIHSVLELHIQFVITGNSEVFASETVRFYHIPGRVLAIISAYSLF